MERLLLKSGKSIFKISHLIFWMLQAVKYLIYDYFYCVTQLMLYTGDKLSSSIFCCLSVCQASVSPDQILPYNHFLASKTDNLVHLEASPNKITKSMIMKLLNLGGLINWNVSNAFYTAHWLCERCFERCVVQKVQFWRKRQMG